MRETFERVWSEWSRATVALVVCLVCTLSRLAIAGGVMEHRTSDEAIKDTRVAVSWQAKTVEHYGIGKLERLVFGPNGGRLAVQGDRGTTFWRLDAKDEQGPVASGIARGLGAVELPDDRTAAGLRNDPEWRGIYDEEVLRFSFNHPDVAHAVRLFPSNAADEDWHTDPRWAVEPDHNFKFRNVSFSKDGRHFTCERLSTEFAGGPRYFYDTIDDRLIDPKFSGMILDSAAPALFLLYDVWDHSKDGTYPDMLYTIYDARAGRVVDRAPDPEGIPVGTDKDWGEIRLTPNAELVCLTKDAARSSKARRSPSRTRTVSSGSPPPRAGPRTGWSSP